MNKSIAALVLVALVATGFYASYASEEPLAESPAGGYVFPSLARSTDEIIVLAGKINAAAAAQAIPVGSPHKVIWNPADFPSDSVKISLLRKQEDGSFILARVLEPAADNDGLTIWTPSTKEGGDNIYVEVSCGEPADGCATSVSQVSFTLVE